MDELDYGMKKPNTSDPYRNGWTTITDAYYKQLVDGQCNCATGIKLTFDDIDGSLSASRLKDYIPGSAITGYIDSDLLSGSWHLESGSFKTGYSGPGIAGSSVHGYLSDDVTINASKIIGTWERHITGGGTYTVTGYGIPAGLISGTLSADMLKGTIASGVDVGEMSGYAYNMRIPGGNIQWVTGTKIPGSMIEWKGATIPGTLIDWSGVQIPASAITSGTADPIQENHE